MEKKKKNASFTLPDTNQGNGTKEEKQADTDKETSKKDVQRFDVSKIDDGTSSVDTDTETDSDAEMEERRPRREVLKTRRWSAASFAQTAQHVHSPTMQEDKILLWVWMVTLFPAILWVSNRLLGAGTLAQSNSVWMQVLGFVTFFVWCSLWFKTPKEKWKNAVMSPLGRLYVAVCLICAVVIVCLALTDARSDAGYILYFIFASWLIVIGVSEIPQHKLKEEDSDDGYQRKKQMQTAKSKQTSYRNATWLWGELVMTVAVIVFLSLKITRYAHTAEPAMFFVWVCGLCVAMICYRYGFYMDQLQHHSNFRKHLRMGVHCARVVLIAVFLLVAPDVMYSAAKSHFDETAYSKHYQRELEQRGKKISTLTSTVEERQQSLSSSLSQQAVLEQRLGEKDARIASLVLSGKKLRSEKKEIADDNSRLMQKLAVSRNSFKQKVAELEETIAALGKARSEKRVLAAKLRSAIAEGEAEKRSSTILQKQLSALQQKHKADMSAMNKNVLSSQDILLLKRARALSAADWKWLANKSSVETRLVNTHKAHQMAANQVAALQKQNKVLLAQVSQFMSMRYTLCTSCGQACEQGTRSCPRTYLVNGKKEKCNGGVRLYQSYKAFVIDSNKHNANFVRQLSEALRRLQMKEKTAWLKQQKAAAKKYQALVAAAQARANKLKSDNVQLMQKKSELRLALNKSNQSVRALKLQTKELTKSNAQLLKKNNELVLKLKKFHEINTKLTASEKEVARLTARLAKLSKQAEKVATLNKSIVKKDARIIELNKELTVLNQKVAKQSTSIGKFKTEIAILEQEKKKLTEDLRDERTDTSNIIQRKVRNRTFTLNNSMLKLKRQCDALSKQNTKLVAANKRLAEQLKLEGERLASTKKTLAVLQKKNAKLTTDLGALKRQVSQLTTANTTLAANVRSGGASVKTLAQKNAQQAQELLTLRNQFAAFRKNHKSCSSDYALLKTQFRNLELASKNQKVAHNSSVAQLKNKAKIADAEVTRLKPFETQVKVLSAKVISLTKKQKVLIEQLEKLKGVKSDLVRLTRSNKKLLDCKKKYQKLLQREKLMEGQLAVFKRQYKAVRKELDDLQSRVRVCGHCFEISRDPIGYKCTEPGCAGLISRLVSRKKQKELRKKYLAVKKKD